MSEAAPSPSPSARDTAIASGRLAATAARLGGLTAASRLLGLVRDVGQAALLGAGWAADAFVIAWTIPNLARRIFGEGALTAAFLPVFTRVRERDGESAAMLLAARVLSLLVVGLAVVALCGSVAALLLRGQLAGWLGIDPGKTDLVLGLTALLLPYMPIVCATALCVATLNATDRFALPALPPIVQNLAWIAGLGAAASWAGVAERTYVIGIAIALGAVAGFGLLATNLVRRGLPATPQWAPRDPAVRDVGRLFWPTVLGLAVVQLNILADRAIAEAFVAGDGAVAALYYGHQLMELPMGMIAVAVATVAFPQLARLGAAEDRVGFGRAAGRALRLVLAVSLPAAVGLAVTREPVIQLLFERGRFLAADSARAAGVTLWYAIAVLPASCLPVLARSHHAWADTKTPVRIGTSCVVLNLVLNLLLVRIMAEQGLALATAISAAVQATWLAAALRHRTTIAWRADVGVPAARIAGAAAACGLAAGGALWALGIAGIPPGTTGAAIRCVVGIGVGVVTYAIAARLLGVGEIQTLLRRNSR